MGQICCAKMGGDDSVGEGTTKDKKGGKEKEKKEDEYETSFVAVKPDGVHRGVIGSVISRYEKRGLKICGMKFIWPTKKLIEKHYFEHKGKFFYEKLLNFLTSGPVLALAVSGKNAIAQIRKMNGATHPAKAMIATIRGGKCMMKNLVHSSDSQKSAKAELSLWFKKEEILLWEKSGEKKWVYE